MEKSTFVPAASLQESASESVFTGTTFVDETWEVSLVDVPFAPVAGIDPATIPVSAYAAPKEAPSAGVVVEKDETGVSFAKVADPAGGWDFVSLGGVYPKTIYGFRVDADGNFRGCNLLPDGPVLLTGAGQHIILGKIQLRGPASPLAQP